MSYWSMDDSFYPNPIKYPNLSTYIYDLGNETDQNNIDTCHSNQEYGESNQNEKKIEEETNNIMEFEENNTEFNQLIQSHLVSQSNFKIKHDRSNVETHILEMIPENIFNDTKELKFKFTETNDLAAPVKKTVIYGNMLALIYLMCICLF